MPRVKSIPKRYSGARKTKYSGKFKRSLTSLYSKRKFKSGRSSSNSDTFSTTISGTLALTPSQGAGTNNYLYGLVSMLNNATGVLNLTTSKEFLMWRNLYDQFRVTLMKVKLIPKGNVVDLVNANLQQESGVLGNVTYGNGRYYTAIDRDSGIPSDVDAIMRYSSHREHKVTSPATRFYYVKYPTGVWLDAQTSTTNELRASLGLFGTVGWYAENLPEATSTLRNTPNFSLEVSWDVTFKGKAIPKLTALGSGGVSVEPWDLTTNLPCSGYSSAANLLIDPEHNGRPIHAADIAEVTAI